MEVMLIIEFSDLENFTCTMGQLSSLKDKTDNYYLRFCHSVQHARNILKLIPKWKYQIKVRY